MDSVRYAVEYLELALKELDNTQEYVAAAYVASALDALKPRSLPDDAGLG